MRVFVAMFVATLWFCLNANGQLVCLNAQSADTTAYTNGMPNDSLYFVCGSQNATVVATPTAGIPGWNFRWFYFSSASNSWIFASEDVNMPSSSRNLPNGGFKVEIFDGSGALTESYICWVCRVFFPPIVNANTIPAGCTSVQLSGLFFTPQITSYFNPPPFTTDQPVIVDDASQFEVCFDVNHNFVSDLSFHLIGPESCGSPHAVLSAAPFELEEDTMCNSGSDANMLCFSSSSIYNLNVCENAPFSLTGTYGSYGQDIIPIDWSVFYGCDANSEDWSVQVYDCVAGVTGIISSASLIITDQDVNGNTVVFQYATDAGFIQVIPDSMCSLDDDLQITLESQPIPASAIPIVFNTEWIADPPFEIPNAINDLNIILDPAPTVDTYFTLRLTGPAIGDACDGYVSDVEFYDYIAPDEAIISASDNVFCISDSAVTLYSDITEGVWTGPGVVNSSTGVFDPSVAGPGIWEVAFVPESSCIEGDAIQMLVAEPQLVSIGAVPALCSSSEIVDLEVNGSGGLWQGEGIVNAATGLFDPSLITDGEAEVCYHISGTCITSDTVFIDVVQFEPLALGVEEDVLCLHDDPVSLMANQSGGNWNGAGIVDNLFFDPTIAGVGTWNISYEYNGVCSDEAEISIVVEDPAIDVSESLDICIDAPSFELTESPQGGVWSGNGIVNQLNGVFNPQSIGLPGDYTVYYQIDNACSPIDSLTIHISDYPEIELILPEGVCPESAAFSLDANITGGTWTGNAVDATGLLFDPELAVLGDNPIVYSYDGVCDVQVFGSVELYDSPVITASPDTSICNDGSAVISASGGYEYYWQPANDLNQTTGSEVTAAPGSSTSYTVTGYSEQGCVGSDIVEVEVFPQPIVAVNGPFAICQEENVQLIASGLESYTWSGQGLSGYEIANPIADPSDNTTYVVGGFDINGCYGEATVSVEVIIPVASFEANAQTGVSPFEPILTNTSAGDIFYWDFGNGDSLVTYDVNETVQPEFYGVENFTVVLTSVIDGCESTYSLEFESYFDSEILLIPNVVSMNGDNKNDRFRILSQNLDKLDVDIFDRWDKKVGNFSGPEASWSPSNFGAGTYYYHYTAIGLDNEQYQGSGSFTVIGISE